MVATQREAAKPVVLGPGDALGLAFPGAPDLNHSQRIRQDGKLALPLVGEIQAAGRTVSQLRQDLSTRYSAQLQNAEVVVTVEARGTPVMVTGAVGRPGRLVLDRPTTALEAVMEAGGFGELANQSKVRLIRVENGVYRSQALDLKAAMQGEAARAIYLRPGDMIHVPERLW